MNTSDVSLGTVTTLVNFRTSRNSLYNLCKENLEGTFGLAARMLSGNQDSAWVGYLVTQTEQISNLKSRKSILKFVLKQCVPPVPSDILVHAVLPTKQQNGIRKSIDFYGVKIPSELHKLRSIDEIVQSVQIGSI